MSSQPKPHRDRQARMPTRIPTRALSSLTLGELRRGLSEYERRWKRVSACPMRAAATARRLSLGEFRRDSAQSCFRPSERPRGATLHATGAMRRCRAHRRKLSQSRGAARTENTLLARVDGITSCHATRRAPARLRRLLPARQPAACAQDRTPSGPSPLIFRYLRARTTRTSAKMALIDRASPGKTRRLCPGGPRASPQRSQSFDRSLLV